MLRCGPMALLSKNISARGGVLAGLLVVACSSSTVTESGGGSAGNSGTSGEAGDGNGEAGSDSSRGGRTNGGGQSIGGLSGEGGEQNRGGTQNRGGAHNRGGAGVGGSGVAGGSEGGTQQAGGANVGGRPAVGGDENAGAMPAAGDGPVAGQGLGGEGIAGTPEQGGSGEEAGAPGQGGQSQQEGGAPQQGGSSGSGQGGSGGTACPTSGPDRCDVPGDDSDCNGVQNEDCPCVGNEVEDCNDCGTRTCDGANRAWGACQRVASPPAPSCTSETALSSCDAEGNWVPQECNNPDAAHCVALCNSVTDECYVEAADGDGDGYGSSLCSASAGTDCNDGTSSIRPGLSESCDGLDNDCNGLVDFADNLNLAGTNQSAEGRLHFDFAWTPSLASFGIVHLSYPGTGALYGTLSPAGSLSLRDTAFFEAPTMSHRLPHIAWSPNMGRFGVSLTTVGYGTVDARFIDVYTDGTAGTQQIIDVNEEGGSHPDVATRGNGDLLYAHAMHYDVAAGAISQSATYTFASRVESTYGADSVRVATSGSEGMAVWQGFEETGNDRHVSWARLDSSLTLGAATDVGSWGRNPDVTALGDGSYAIAWAMSNGFGMQIVQSNGQVSCGPTTITFGNQVLDAGDAVAIESTSAGIVVLAVDAGGDNETAPSPGQVSLFLMSTSCQLRRSQDIDGGVSAGFEVPNMAVGGGYLAMGWTSAPTTDTRNAYVRVMSERLCN